MTAFDSSDPKEQNEPTQHGLRVRIAPNTPSAEDHAQFLLKRQFHHNGQPPIIPSREQAVVPTTCDQCDEQMWAPVTSRNHICTLCREKEETTRQTFLGQIMDRFT